jgi:porin
MWLEQSFEPANVSVRFGQLAADSEFLLSTFSGQFVNATFGWPDVAAANMTSGGPAYPLATPGVRVKWEPSKRITLLAALFNGDPAGKSDPDPQLANRNGTNFRTGDPALLMVEGQYKLNGEKTDKGLATTAKLGTWAHFGSFNDLRYDSTGTPIAQSNATGAVLHRDWGVYGVLDQQLWRPAGAGPDQGIGFFTRTAFAPSDRNLIDFYLDGGFVFAGLMARRPDDSFGVALAYDKISDRARGLDQDNVAIGNIQPIRSQQVTLEAFYKAQVVPGFTVQPDFQYIWHPGGGAADPNNGARAIPDAAVVGVRTTINY